MDVKASQLTVYTEINFVCSEIRTKTSKNTECAERRILLMLNVAVHITTTGL